MMGDAPQVQALADYVARYPKLVVVTGAGCSTGSGIGDYRDSEGRWKHAQPIQYADFMASQKVRQRYWARSLLGWPQFARAEPNSGHRALVALERADHLVGLITQNVDGLHQFAGHQRVLDLHGRLDWVSCQECHSRVTRASIQDRLMALNGSMLPVLHEQQRLEQSSLAGRAAPAPDGDAQLTVINAGFKVPECLACGGVLKPDVVFYGQSVPKPWVEQAYEWVAQADGLLVVGSSLMVFSSFRFCRAAAASDTPIAVLNRGVTRADDLAILKVNGECGQTLCQVLKILGIEVPGANSIGSRQ